MMAFRGKSFYFLPFLVLWLTNRILGQTICSTDPSLSVNLHDFTPASSNLTYGGWANSLNPSGGASNPLRLTNGLAQDTTAASGNLESDLAYGEAYTTNTVALPSDFSFSTYFSFRIYNNVGFPDPVNSPENNTNGADGLLFIVQANSNIPLFHSSQSPYRLAYQYMPKSIAVEFDTFKNPEVNDPNGNHIGVNNAANLHSIATYDNLPNLLNDGVIHYVWIDYNGASKNMQVRFSNDKNYPASPLINCTIDLPQQIGATNTNVFVGFGSAVGAAGSAHDVLEWRFRPKFQPVIVSCPTGQYLNGSSCSPVPAGGLNVDPTSLCYSLCPPGTHSSANFTSCPPCAAGKFASSAGSVCQNCSCERGTCSPVTGECSCPTGWTGTTCNTCAPGYQGSTCQPCPDCGNGDCISGPSDVGLCDCHDGWSQNEDGSCTLCSPGFGGPFCQACSVNCDVCAASTAICDLCTEGMYFYLGGCVSSCPSGSVQQGSVCESHCYIPDPSYSHSKTDFNPSVQSDLVYSSWAADLNPSGNQNPLALTTGHDASGTSAGSVFTSSLINLGPSMTFSTRFTFYISLGSGSPDPFDNQRGGDGLAFIMQRVSNHTDVDNTFALRGLSPSVGVEFDSYRDLADLDVNGNHIGIDVDGNLTSIAEASNVLGNLANSQLWYAWVDYNGAALEVRISKNLTRPASPVVASVLNLPAVFGNDDVYLGFGASVSSAGNTHFVSSWDFRNIYDPYDLTCGTGHYFDGTDCTGCPPGTYQDQSVSQCCRDCIAGTFSVGTAQQCDACAPDKFSAAGASNCTQCTCVHGTCNQHDGTCSACQTGWATANCNTCAPGFFGANCTACSTCGHGQCADGDAGDGSCGCDLGWATNGNGTCLICDIGFGGPSCQTCGDDCAACDPPSECTECGSGNLFQGLCQPECPDGYYSDLRVCLACDADCVTCSGSTDTDCLECNPLRDLMVLDEEEQSGTCVCKPGSFEHRNTTIEYQQRLCWTCDESCATMSCVEGQPEQCLTCATNYTWSESRTCVFQGPTSPPTNTPTSPPTSKPTLPVADSALSQGAIIGIAVGLSFLALVIIALALVMVRMRRQQKKEKESFSSQMHLVMADYRMSRDQTAAAPRDGDATMLNTTLEVSLPGFLALTFEQQVRSDEPLAAGGSGVLFRGSLLDPALIQRHKTEKVIIKIVPTPENFTDEETDIIFRNEVSIMWSLSFHRNITTLVGYCNSPRCLLTRVYERDLYSFLHSNNQPISLNQKEILLLDIAHGISAMHELNVCHRDVKSSNVLIATDTLPSGQFVKRGVICDFGLAVVGDSERVVEVKGAKTAHVMGFSPRYTAPEVFARAHAKTNTHTDVTAEKMGDVYAFGVIIWEMLSQAIPWNSLKVTEIEVEVRSGKRPSPLPTADGEKDKALLIAIMEKCWDGNATERPKMMEVHKKLREGLQLDIKD